MFRLCGSPRRGTGARRWSRFGRLGYVVIVAAVAFVSVGVQGATAVAAGGVPGADVPGASIEELLALLDGVNPTLHAALLETEVAEHDVTIAGAWPDPEVSIAFEDIDRSKGGVQPDRLGSIFYGIDQAIPLWGKLGIEQDIARARVAKSETATAALRDGLAESLRIAFADYYHTHHVALILNESLGLIDAVIAAAESRYTQGVGEQGEIILAASERVPVLSAMIDRERDLRAARSAINALLGRPAAAPLAAPRELWSIPATTAISVDDVIGRARDTNPLVHWDGADIAAAEAERRLAQVSWYPDVTLGFSLVDRDRTIDGYEARVGFSLPLQWGLRQAKTMRAGAMLAAAQSRRQATLVDLEGQVADAYWALAAEQERQNLLTNTYWPEADLAWRSALAGYGVGAVGLTDVLVALRRLLDARLEILENEVGQRRLAARLERLVGGAL